ncbi:serine O-acetyltransferase EpsC [Acetobacter lambici]|uniref:Serine acetyltransferase n=1 Tax=Acetobacter lambici TaxID=1332824 RepID=A0ABT1F1M0_9PROT|nr:serine O-acetyltransferase EpsC [Acetobacter lambici]MCP1242938.1 serine O-acetyltransferase [Acetobacter lambici]MCP1259105.1 serine O-acetyltransferase [Acetobacter lambici]
MVKTMQPPHPAATHEHNALFAHRIWSRLQTELQDPAPKRLWPDYAAQHTAPARTLLARLVAEKLGDPIVPFAELYALFCRILEQSPAIMVAAAQDLQAYATKSPTRRDYLTPFMHLKGFQAVQAYRLAHILWRNGLHLSALHLQSRVSEVMGIDIHPAATLGHRLVLAPGYGIVIGETALVENDVVLMSDITLGGTGKHAGKRHPTVRRGALIGPDTQILGAIEIGEGAKIGAGAVVVKPVSPFTAVAGNPARYVNSHAHWPVLTMDLSFPSIDYLI